jgi:hypothetical protein
MSFIQRTLRAILPRRWPESMEAESRSWVVRCPCGFAQSDWDWGAAFMMRHPATNITDEPRRHLGVRSEWSIAIRTLASRPVEGRVRNGPDSPFQAYGSGTMNHYRFTAPNAAKQTFLCSTSTPAKPASRNKSSWYTSGRGVSSFST